MNRFLLVLFTVFALAFLGCKESERHIVVESRLTSKSDSISFIQDTGNYIIIHDTSVAESLFNEDTLNLSQGGFTSYFKSESQKHGIFPKKIFFSYSDSTKPFVKDYSEPSFFRTVGLAYAKHYSLEINPDDIWLLLLDGIRIHVKVNRETLKNRFVGKETDTNIVVDDNSLSFESTESQWNNVIVNLFDELQERIPKETGTLLDTRFSTTSSTDYNVSRTMVLSIASEYYSYEVYTLCGIPSIKINGTKADWNLLKERFNMLAQKLEMTWWSNNVNPVLDEFIRAFENNTNIDFWKGIYKYTKAKGCGEVSTFNGWVSKFIPYTEKHNKYTQRTIWDEGIPIDAIPKGISSFDIKWNYLGDNIPLKLFTGFVGTQVDVKHSRLKVSRGYALMMFCDWCTTKVSKDYIQGKPYQLHEMIAIADSMNVYGRKGLSFATKNRDILDEYAKANVLERTEEIYQGVFQFYDPFKNEPPKLTVNLYKNGELIDHVDYFGHGFKTLQWYGFFKSTKLLEKFFTKKKLLLNETSAEFAFEKKLPKIKINYNAESFVLKDWDEFAHRVDNHGILNMKILLNYYLQKFCDWRLQRAYYRNYKTGEEFDINAEITFNEDGTVSDVSIETGDSTNQTFLSEVNKILRHIWISNAYIFWENEKKDTRDVVVKSFKTKIKFRQKKIRNLAI